MLGHLRFTPRRREDEQYASGPGQLSPWTQKARPTALKIAAFLNDFGRTTLDGSPVLEKPLSAMRTALGVDALLSQSQPLNRTSTHQMLLHDLDCIRRLHMAIPHSLRVNHYGRPVFALVQAHGFIDAHRCAQTGGFRQLLQLRMELTFSVSRAGRPGSIGGAGVVANKDVTFKRGQAVFLLDRIDERPYMCGYSETKVNVSRNQYPHVDATIGERRPCTKLNGIR